VSENVAKVTGEEHVSDAGREVSPLSWHVQLIMIEGRSWGQGGYKSNLKPHFGCHTISQTPSPCMVLACACA
jgi:hypothetical protein